MVRSSMPTMVITLWREAMKTSRLNCKQSIAEGGHTWHSNTCGMLMSGVLMLALPGCTAMAYLPDEAPMTEPSVSVSEEWNGARTSAGINAAELGWQAYFPDPALQQS